LDSAVLLPEGSCRGEVAGPPKACGPLHDGRRARRRGERESLLALSRTRGALARRVHPAAGPLGPSAILLIVTRRSPIGRDDRHALFPVPRPHDPRRGDREHRDHPLARLAIAPSISAGVLPLVLESKSFWYPPSVLLVVIALSILSTLWRKRSDRGNPDSGDRQARRRRRARKPPARFAWLVALLAFVAVTGSVAQLTGSTSSCSRR